MTAQDVIKIAIPSCLHVVTPESTTLVIRELCPLVRARLGKQERAFLLRGNTETWTPIPEWRTDGNRHSRRYSAISRTLTRLEKLKLIERAHLSSWQYGERDESNSILVTRSDKDGFKSSYRMYVSSPHLKLTPLGAAVVDQFRDALTTGKRIRWSRFTPPPEPPPPPPPPEPVKLSPEQEELRARWDQMKSTSWHRSFLTSELERARKYATDLPELEKIFQAMQRDVEEWERRITELEAQGVTLPEQGARS